MKFRNWLFAAVVAEVVIGNEYAHQYGEAVGNAKRMFARMDSNSEGKISSDEVEASRRK